MPLLPVPCLPNRHEHFILRNRRILADEMEYLLAGVPRELAAARRHRDRMAVRRDISPPAGNATRR